MAKARGSNAGETIYFNGVPIALHNPTSGAYTDLIYAGKSMIAEVAGTQTAVPTYRVSDHLGSLAVQTNNSGGATGSNTFLPFGQTLTQTTADQFQFTGLPQDTENGSYHAGSRGLSYEQGRWLSPDPYTGSYDVTNPQSFNRYSYVNNNPMGFVDPSGLCDPSLLSSDCDILDDGGGGGGGGDGGDSGDGGDGGYDPGCDPTVCGQQDNGNNAQQNNDNATDPYSQQGLNTMQSQVTDLLAPEPIIDSIALSGVMIATGIGVTYGLYNVIGEICELGPYECAAGIVAGGVTAIYIDGIMVKGAVTMVKTVTVPTLFP